MDYDFDRILGVGQPPPPSDKSGTIFGVLLLSQGLFILATVYFLLKYLQ